MSGKIGTRKYVQSPFEIGLIFSTMFNYERKADLFIFLFLKFNLFEIMS